MKEYFVKEVSTNNLQDELNAFCKQGWDIFQIDFCQTTFSYIIIAERRS
jgi:hypothetical protein